MNQASPSDPGIRVFVYGTLRSGASNHFRMAGACLHGSGTIRARMYRIDWFPGLRLDPEAGRIVGEVYEVSPDQLAELDRFEGVSAEESGHSEYRRVPVEVELDCGQTLIAWVWEWNGPVDETQLMGHGDWLQEMVDPQV